MSKIFEDAWPVTRNWKVSILWSLGCGFILQIAVPLLLQVFGAHRAASYAMLPGLWPILWATGGWFAGISPTGYLVLFSINTLAYALLLFVGFRTCAFVSRHNA